MGINLADMFFILCPPLQHNSTHERCNYLTLMANIACKVAKIWSQIDPPDVFSRCAATFVGRTALHFAAEHGRMDLLETLLCARANPHIKSETGERAVDVALT